MQSEIIPGAVFPDSSVRMRRAGASASKGSSKNREIGRIAAKWCDADAAGPGKSRFLRGSAANCGVNEAALVHIRARNLSDARSAAMLFSDCPVSGVGCGPVAISKVVVLPSRERN